MCKCKCFPFVRKEDSERERERELSRENAPSRGVRGERITIFDLRELDDSICVFAFRLVWVCAAIRVIFMKWHILPCDSFNSHTEHHVHSLSGWMQRRSNFPRIVSQSFTLNVRVKESFVICLFNFHLAQHLVRPLSPLTHFH